MLLTIIRIAIAVFTALVGLYSMVWPERIEGFTGLKADSPRAASEIRAVMGGVFVALAVAPLIFRRMEALQVLGLTYAVIAVVRLVAIFVDNAQMRSNWVSLGSEVVMAVLLLIGW